MVQITTIVQSSISSNYKIKCHNFTRQWDKRVFELTYFVTNNISFPNKFHKKVKVMLSLKIHFKRASVLNNFVQN